MQDGDFHAKSTMQDVFGGIKKMKNILVIEGDTPDLDLSGAAKKQQEQTATEKLKKKLPTDLEIESIPMKDLSTFAEQVHVAMREAVTNTDLNMKEFLGINKAFRRV